MSESEKPNAHMVFLPTELYMGLIKKMAAFEIGKSAAILDSINEDLFNEGFISKEAYEKFRAAYRKKLVDVVKAKEEATVKEPSVEVQQLKKVFVMVSEQWDSLSPKAREHHVKKALELKDCPEAKEILRKAGVLNE
jgi:hypothetical protein